MIQSNTPSFFDNHFAVCRECRERTTGLEARLRNFNENRCHCGGELDFVPPSTGEEK